jgi:hypothetical protein
VLQSYELRTTRRLVTRHVDEEEQPFKELVHLLKVRLHCLLLIIRSCLLERPAINQHAYNSDLACDGPFQVNLHT